MAIRTRTFVKNLIAKITNQKERYQKKIAIIRFRDHKVTARVLAITLEKGIECVPNFLDFTDYITYLTLTFKDNTSEISIFFLPELRKFGWQSQADSLEAVINNWSQVLYKDESQMREYIRLLWNLFHTPDPE